MNELLWGHHEYSSGVGTIITCSYFIIFFLFFMHSVGLFAVVSPDLHLQAHTLYIATCAPRVRSQIFTTCTLRRLSQPSSCFGWALSLSLSQSQLEWQIQWWSAYHICDTELAMGRGAAGGWCWVHSVVCNVLCTSSIVLCSSNAASLHSPVKCDSVPRRSGLVAKSTRRGFQL